MKSQNWPHLCTKSNLVIFIHRVYTLITLPTFLNICEKNSKELVKGTKVVVIFLFLPEKYHRFCWMAKLSFHLKYGI